MATTTVNTGGGGDYTTLSAWEAGRQGNLTGLGVERVECSGAAADTTAVTVDGWTTTAADYIEIVVPQASRHAGVWNTGKYRLQTAANFSACLTISERYTRVAGLQFKNAPANEGSCVTIPAAAVGDVRIENCIMAGGIG